MSTTSLGNCYMSGVSLPSRQVLTKAARLSCTTAPPYPGPRRLNPSQRVRTIILDEAVRSGGRTPFLLDFAYVARYFPEDRYESRAGPAWHFLRSSTNEPDIAVAPSVCIYKAVAYDGSLADVRLRLTRRSTRCELHPPRPLVRRRRYSTPTSLLYADTLRPPTSAASTSRTITLLAS